MANNSYKQVFSSLESCRGLAAFAVVLYHIPWATSITSTALIRHMYMMVDLFFVLSGFVIFHTYRKRIYSATSAARFLWLRIGRLYPLHLFMLMVFLLIELCKFGTDLLLNITANNPAFTENNLGSFAVNLLLLQSWGVTGYRTWNFASWSISVEFYLYVVIASLMVVFAHIRGIFWMLVSIMISSIAAYLLMREGATESQYVDVLRGFTGFFAGVFIYEIRRYLMTLDMRAKVLEVVCNVMAVNAVIATVLLLNRDGFAPYVWAYPIFAILVLSLSLLPDKQGINRLLTAKILLWLGQISYSLYMVHQALLWGFKQFTRVVLHAPQIIVHEQKMFSTSFWIGHLLLICAVSLALACAHVSYRYVEDRYRRKSRAIAELYFSEAASDQLASRSAA